MIEIEDDDDAALRELVLFRSAMASVADGPHPPVTMGTYPERCWLCGKPQTNVRVGEERAYHNVCLATAWRKRRIARH
jgi:hypothetical protein